MANKVLLVDDEEQLLQGLRRNLQGEFEVVCSNSPAAALETLASGEEFSVIVSDYKMPGMNGVELLQRAKTLVPDTVRIVLSGFADLEIVTNAINEGSIFRFLSKPCPPEKMRAALRGGIEQFRLIRAEKDLLEKTLMGCIQVMSELLSSFDPTLYSRVRKTRAIIQVIGKGELSSGIWEAEMAALLSSLGWLTVPPMITSGMREGRQLGGDELRVVREVPQATARLLQHIPRMDSVTEAILREQEPFSAGLAGEAPRPWMVLRACRDLVGYREAKGSYPAALEELVWHAALYHPLCISLITERMDEILLLDKSLKSGVLSVPVHKLKPGMLLQSPISTRGGLVIVSAPHELNAADIERIRNFSTSCGVSEPIQVIV